MSAADIAPDVIVEFTLRSVEGDALTAPEIRAPLFLEPGDDLAFGAIIDLRGLGPVRRGETHQAPARFIFPEGARAHFAEGAHFWSHGLEGRVLQWLPTQVAAE